MPTNIGPHRPQSTEEQQISRTSMAIDIIPLSPAIISAIKDATGLWFDKIPLIPEEVQQKIILSSDNL